MRTAVIENPVINSPFDEPSRHFQFESGEITSEVVPGRRISKYYVPIPQARVRGGQTQLVLGETPNDEERENELINAIRTLVKRWRSTDYEGLNNPVTRRLLEH